MLAFKLSTYRITFKASQAIRLPGYSGSAWRGAFGHALKQAVCVTQMPACGACPLLHDCPYPMIFETAHHLDRPGLLGQNQGIPHPYILSPGWTTGSIPNFDSNFDLNVTLVGRATDHSAIVFKALIEAARHGIGPDRVSLALVKILNVATPLDQPCPDRLTLSFLTPLRLTEQGHLVAPDALAPRHVLGALVRRISLLAQYHQDQPFDGDFIRLKRLAQEAVFLQTELGWQDWTRHSSRQQALVKMGGIMGYATLSMSGLDEFWPLLRLAPALHIGKGATMGLGAIALGVG